MIAKETSIKLANCQWILAVLIVMIHSTTLMLNMPNSNGEITSSYGANITTFLQLLFSEGICRIAVPMFFIFSGYLYFQGFHLEFACYLCKIVKRAKSIVIPYLFWSALTFLVFYFAQRIENLSPYFSTRDTRNLDFMKSIYFIVIDSFDSPLWYCKYLFCLFLISPVIYWLLQELGVVWLFLALILYVHNFIGVQMRLEPLFYFSWGGYLAVCYFPDKDIVLRLSHPRISLLICSFAYLTFLVSRTMYLCNCDKEVLLTGKLDNYLLWSEKLLILWGIPLFWRWLDLLPKTFIGRRWEVSRASFLLYVIHHPLCAAIKKIVYKLSGGMIHNLIQFVLTAGTTIMLVVIIWHCLRRINKMPHFSWVGVLLSGGRL